MPFIISRRHFGRDGAEHSTVTKASASEAWAYVQELAASHELVTIKDPSGRIIDWVELRALAQGPT